MLEAFAEHYVVSPQNLQVAFHQLTDNFDFPDRISDERLHDQMHVVAADVVNEHQNFEHHTQVFVALVMSRYNVLAIHVVKIMNFAPIVILLDEWSLLF